MSIRNQRTKQSYIKQQRIIDDDERKKKVEKNGIRTLNAHSQKLYVPIDGTANRAH